VLRIVNIKNNKVVRIREISKGERGKQVNKENVGIREKKGQKRGVNKWGIRSYRRGE